MMRLSDILLQSLRSLFRRKLRTLLTMLGVVIGTAAIVVTLSLGAGAEQAQMELLESTENLRLIEVYPYYSVASGRITRMNDNTVRDLRAMPHVAAVTPIVTVMTGSQYIIETGDCENRTTLIAVSPSDFALIQPLKSGTYFSGRTDRMEFIMSEISLMEFRDPDKPYIWNDAYSLLLNGEELPLPEIDWYGSRYELNIEWENYENYEANNFEPEIERISQKAALTGIMEADINDPHFSYCAIVSLDWLKKFVRSHKGFCAEQGLDISTYDTAYVLADSVDAVEPILKELHDYGIQYSSPLETVQLMKRQIATMQGFLGFIGAISMLVAALSIANTMMMSVYERTKEIGIMKVLGCSLGAIRAMFLCEAAYIGIFGGGLGLIASYLLSYAVNNVRWLQEIVAKVLSGYEIFTSGSAASVISPSLAGGAYLFAVVIALLSGIVPARRAMKQSSLAALRSE